MENNFINIKLKRYVYYLNKIGLLPEEDNLKINNIFYEIGKLNAKLYKQKISNVNYILSFFKENITKTLSLFLGSLNQEQKNKISLNIYQRYLSNEKLFDIEKIYSLNKLFLKLKLRKIFRKIFFFSKNNYNYNFLYNPNILNKSNNTIEHSSYKVKYQKLKKVPNYTRNTDDNNKVRLSNIGKIIESINQNKNNPGDNNTNNTITISKISDLGVSWTFSKENSPFVNQNELDDKKIIENNINHSSHNQIIYQTKQNKKIHLFNKKTNLKLKINPHFEYLGKLCKPKKQKEISKQCTTEYLKEKEEIKNCTFKPKINIINTTPKLSLKKEKSYNIKRIEKLYLDNQRKMDKRTEGILLRDNKISRENTFQPKFVSISVKKLKKNFSLRMYKFNQLKEENKQKLIKSIETENSTIYTFSPKLNNNCSQKNNNKNQNKRIPAYERLYTKNKYLKRKTEEITKDHKSLSMNNKSVDYQKIQKLYEEYKLLKQKRQKDQKILDEERGITFNPQLINGNKYKDKITPDFFEREKKFVEEHQNHIEAYKNFLNKEKEKYFKRFSQDKKIIVKNVVHRLYNEELYKKMNNKNDYNYLYSKTENNNINDNYDGKESIILSKSNKSNKSSNSLNKNEEYKLKNSLSNQEMQISVKSSKNFSLSQLINDKF